MAKIRYRDWNPRPESMERVVYINEILKEYQGRVTVRQLYYRLVAAGKIANNDREYDRVQALLTDARYGGAIDWNAIEDRNREAEKAPEWGSGKALLETASQQFRLDRWESQPFYVELWVEKAALAGVLAPIAHDYHLTLMVNRGYSSASAMKEAAERIIHRSRGSKSFPSGHRPVILYIGDHDPSGLHMEEDIMARLLEFHCPPNLSLRRVALTMEQVRRFNPPPNPAKLTDSRAKDYIARWGDLSWEADALPPDVLDLTTRQIVSSYIDKEAMKEVMTREQRVKTRIAKFAETLSAD